MTSYILCILSIFPFKVPLLKRNGNMLKDADIPGDASTFRRSGDACIHRYMIVFW